MPAITQKELESWALQRFRAALADFPDGPVRESERPDFLVESQLGTIGLELTELFRETAPGQQPMQEAESLRARICATAQRQFEGAGGAYHQVFVHFAPHARLRRDRVQPLADFVIRTVASFDLKNGETGELALDWDTVADLPDEITTLWAWRPPRDVPCVWQSSEVGWIGQCTREDLVRGLERKESLLPVYRAKAPTQWLVLLADGFSISRMFEPPDPEAIGPLTTGFDRVYYFDAFRQHVVALQTVAPGAA